MSQCYREDRGCQSQRHSGLLWCNDLRFQGSWNPQGPTDFHSNLCVDINANPYGGEDKYYSVAEAIETFLGLGADRSKLIVGIPYYGRGWTGVNKDNNGLYQRASDAADAADEPGYCTYNILINKPGTVYHEEVTKQAYKYDGNDWWSYDDVEVIAEKAKYIKSNGLAGTMV